MAPHDERIAWLLTAGAIGHDGAEAIASLSVGAEAGFLAVAMSPSVSTSDIGHDIHAEARRLGMRCIVLNEAAHYRLAVPLGEAERRAQAHVLSCDGFDGTILCVSCEGLTRAESLLATARALVRDLDQRDWESYH